MKLQFKFIIFIGGVLILSYSAILYYTSSLQNNLIIGQAKQQARMLHRHLTLTREWISDHQGLFVVRTDTVKENPYLDAPSTETSGGLILVKRNPAMVTRELSEYTSRAGFGWFKVTSLKPVNPLNAPDKFEESSLKTFEITDLCEYMEISNQDDTKVLRYIAPLLVKKTCLSCHAKHGYRIGDIRGALSITIPIAWADKVIKRHNRTIILYGVLSVLVVSGMFFLLFHLLVASRLDRLKVTMDNYPNSKAPKNTFADGNDEIAHLSQGFSSLCSRLENNTNELSLAKENAFYNEKMAALGQITAGIAHEVNNPLGGLRNCVKNMKDAPDDLDLHARYLPLLDKGLAQIEQTLRQLLNFGRDNPLQLRKVDIDGEIRECFALLGYKMNNIELSLNLYIGGTYCIDTEAIKQIVVNIGLNAIQAMTDEGILKVRSWKIADFLYLEIGDNGCGIEARILDKIYDPFFTTKDVGEGTGLGLAVTYSLVHKMGGSIRVDSTPSSGTTFLITLPSQQQCNSANQMSCAEPPLPESE